MPESIDLTYPTASISAAYSSARALLQPGGMPELCWGLSPCTLHDPACALPGPPTPTRFSSRRERTFALCVKEGASERRHSRETRPALCSPLPELR